MDNKYMITQGGSLKAVDGIRDSWDFVQAMEQGTGTELYAKVAAVYRAVNLTADATSNMPFAIVNDNGEDVDTSADWKNVTGTLPHPRDLIRLWRMSLAFTNTAYARLASTNIAKKQWFYVVPNTMRIVVNNTNGTVDYIERVPTKEKFKPDDKNLFYMWRLDHTTELLPSPNTEFLAMMQSAGILYSADFWAQNYFKNGAVKPTIVSVKGMVTNDKKDELQTAWAKFMRGLGKTWAELAKVINADAMDVKQIGDGLGDIKDSPVYNQAIENIAMANGMPLSLLKANSANRATAETEYASWFRDTVTPTAYWMQEQINDKIMPKGFYFEFRPEQSEPSQQEEVDRAQAYSTYVSSGMKPSVAAQVVGIDLPNGVEYDDLDPEEAEVPSNDTPATQTGTGTNQEPVQDDQEDVSSDEMPAKAWKELDIWKRKAVKAMKRGEPLPMDFVCEFIPLARADAIKASLINAGNVEQVAEAFETTEVPIEAVEVKAEPDPALLVLAEALNNAAKAAMVKPEVKAEPIPPVFNITMPSINLTAQMPEQGAPSVTVNIPDQPAPIVNVEAAQVNVTNEVQPAAVKVDAPVTVNMPERKPISAELTTDPRTGKKVIKAK